MGFVDIATVFEAMGSFYNYSPCQEARPALTEEDVQRGTKKGKWMKCGNSISRKVTLLSKCEWWKLYKADVSVKEQLRESFPYKRSVRQDKLLDQIKSGALFDYVQCDIKVPEHQREKFAIFPRISKIQTYVDKIPVQYCRSMLRKKG